MRGKKRTVGLDDNYYNRADNIVFSQKLKMVSASQIGKSVVDFAESLVGGNQFEAAHQALLQGNTKAFAKDLSLGLASDVMMVIPFAGEIRMADEMGKSISLFEKGARMRRTSQISGLLKELKTKAIAKPSLVFRDEDFKGLIQLIQCL